MDLRRYIRDVPDFPKKGIVFKDITPLLNDRDALQFALTSLSERFRDREISKVVGIESRGTLEYGKDRLEIHTDAIRPGERVLIVDDLLATGGTASATRSLVERLEGNVVGAGFLVELTFLEGRSRLPGIDVVSLIGY